MSPTKSKPSFSLTKTVYVNGKRVRCKSRSDFYKKKKQNQSSSSTLPQSSSSTTKKKTGRKRKKLKESEAHVAFNPPPAEQSSNVQRRHSFGEGEELTPNTSLTPSPSSPFSEFGNSFGELSNQNTTTTTLLQPLNPQVPVGDSGPLQGSAEAHFHPLEQFSFVSLLTQGPDELDGEVQLQPISQHLQDSPEENSNQSPGEEFHKNSKLGDKGPKDDKEDDDMSSFFSCNE